MQPQPPAAVRTDRHDQRVTGIEAEDSAPCASTRSWFDREPLKIWLPFSAVAAAAVQTVAYVGYKLFYTSFGVRPEEVGYDYASLFPRTAFQLALIIAAGLLILSALSLLVAFVSAVIVPTFKRRGHARLSSGDRGVLLLLAAMTLSALIARIVGNRHFGLILLASCVLVFVVNHLRARRAGSPQNSALSQLAAPRIYRGGRRITLLLVAAASAAAFDVSDLDDLPLLLVVVVIVYSVDRAVPVSEIASETDARGMVTSKWFRRTITLAAVGAVAVGFLSMLSFALDASRLDRKVAQVREGGRLDSDLLNVFTLAEPRAELVRVRWVGPDPQPPFVAGRAHALTYFGQNAGTSIFFDPAARPRMIYRVPTAAVQLEAAARNSLEGDDSGVSIVP